MTLFRYHSKYCTVCLSFFFYGSPTGHKQWTEIYEIKQIFKGDFKILSDFYKNHFGAPQIQKAFI